MKQLLFLVPFVCGTVEAWISGGFATHQQPTCINIFSKRAPLRWTTLLGLSSTAVSTELAQPEDTTANRLIVTYPAIHWTVPGFKPGWKDVEGTWWDEDGKRNGPPMNYWRQQVDERAYNMQLDVVKAFVGMDDFREKLKQLEGRNVRRPFLNRKILGSWAPIVRNGYLVAESNDDDSVSVPYTIEIYRTQSRKLGPENHYGQFDAHLMDGESISVSFSTGELIGLVQASADNEVRAVVGAVAPREPFFFGGISALSDYVMVTRDDVSNESNFHVRDVWVRYENAEAPDCCSND